MGSLMITIPTLLRRKALALGPSGSEWVDTLEEQVRDYIAAEKLEYVGQLSGGTEALVFLVAGQSGEWVLKFGLPGSLDIEARVLQIAKGHGYVRLEGWNTERNVMKLERLGPTLHSQGFSIRKQIEIIVEACKEAWRPVKSSNFLTTGAEKAKFLAEEIAKDWERLKPPYSPVVRDTALEYALERARAHTNDDNFLIHGDAHCWNTLQRQKEANSYVFVDPEGIIGEPAIDLAISLREWRDELLENKTLARGQDRCRLLSDLADVPVEPIWQWGYLEHVASGCLYLRLGHATEAHRHLTIANEWSVSPTF